VSSLLRYAHETRILIAEVCYGGIIVMLHGGYFGEILSPLCHITNGSRVGLWLELGRFILCDQGSLLFRLSMNPLAHSVYSPHHRLALLYKLPGMVMTVPAPHGTLPTPYRVAAGLRKCGTGDSTGLPLSLSSSRNYVKPRANK